jgi:plastocyanin
MTSRSPTSSEQNWGRYTQSPGSGPSAPALRAITLSLIAALAAPAVTVSGTVELKDSRADAVTRRHDYSGVIVSLRAVDPAHTVTPPAKHAVMVQKDKTFTPHILPVVAGTQVDFPNFDPIFHNAFSNFSGQIFDVGLYPPGSSRTVRFSRPGVVRIFCNIHPAMSAIVLVLDTPFYTTTGKDGAFQLDVPPGSWELSVFHERATEQMLKSLTQRVLVTNEPVRLAPLSLSEAGFILAPHKNKYDHDYAPMPDDKSVYPGVRN